MMHLLKDLMPTGFPPMLFKSFDLSPAKETFVERWKQVQKGKTIKSFLPSNKWLFSSILLFYFAAILILSTEWTIRVLCQSPNLETAKPG